MSAHERFRFKTLDEIRSKVAELGLDLEFDEDLSPPAQVGGRGAASTLKKDS